MGRDAVGDMRVVSVGRTRRTRRRHRSRCNNIEGLTVKMPKPSEADLAFFRTLVPDDPRVELKPMFGQLAAFINGNMFMGLFGSDVGVKLTAPDREELLSVDGAGPFGPAERPMGGYVTLPPQWRSSPNEADRWTRSSARLRGDAARENPQGSEGAKVVLAVGAPVGAPVDAPVGAPRCALPARRFSVRVCVVASEPGHRPGELVLVASLGHQIEELVRRLFRGSRPRGVRRIGVEDGSQRRR